VRPETEKKSLVFLLTHCFLTRANQIRQTAVSKEEAHES